MSLGLRVNTKPKDLTKITKQSQRDISRGITKAIGKTGSLGKEIILDRTELGKGINSAFKAYTPEYMAVLEEEGKPSDTVDLYNTGKMLRSMQTKQLNSRTAQIYFDNPEAAKKAAFNNETRPFFGFSAKEEKQLAVYFRKEMDR
jgi:hypothetical protein